MRSRLPCRVAHAMLHHAEGPGCKRAVALRAVALPVIHILVATSPAKIYGVVATTATIEASSATASATSALLLMPQRLGSFQVGRGDGWLLRRAA